jgi:hypothetical protein
MSDQVTGFDDESVDCNSGKKGYCKGSGRDYRDKKKGQIKMAAISQNVFKKQLDYIFIEKGIWRVLFRIIVTHDTGSPVFCSS